MAAREMIVETDCQALVAMLSPADVPAAARTELKKLLTARNVRKTIAEPIIARILGGATPNPADIPLPPDETQPAAAPRPAVSGQADDIPVVYVRLFLQRSTP